MTVKLLSRLWHARLNQQATMANCGLVGKEEALHE